MKKGFTLIELLVVVLIIGILSAIAVPQYTNAVEKARLAEALTMIGSLKRGIDAYVMANGFIDEEFLGNPDTILDVDVASHLCSPFSDASCEGKHFCYDRVYCETNDPNHCDIIVSRGTTDDYYNGTSKYTLFLASCANLFSLSSYDHQIPHTPIVIFTRTD